MSEIVWNRQKLWKKWMMSKKRSWSFLTASCRKKDYEQKKSVFYGNFRFFLQRVVDKNLPVQDTGDLLGLFGTPAWEFRKFRVVTLLSSRVCSFSLICYTNTIQYMANWCYFYFSFIYNFVIYFFGYECKSV